MGIRASTRRLPIRALSRARQSPSNRIERRKGRSDWRRHTCAVVRDNDPVLFPSVSMTDPPCACFVIARILYVRGAASAPFMPPSWARNLEPAENTTTSRHGAPNDTSHQDFPSRIMSKHVTFTEQVVRGHENGTVFLESFSKSVRTREGIVQQPWTFILGPRGSVHVTLG